MASSGQVQNQQQHQHTVFVDQVPTTLESAVRMVASHIRSTGSLQMDAIRQLWPFFNLTAHDQTKLAQEGFLKMVSAAIHERRFIEESHGITVLVEGGTSTPTPNIEIKVNILEREVYPVNGRSVAVINFTIKDCESCAASFSAQAHAMRHKADVLNSAKKLLSKHKVQEIGQLPPAVIAEIARDWSS